jgi:hypothetical protein
MTKDEALLLALEALEKISMGGDPRWADQAITAIKEALAQPEQDGECKNCTDGCPACDARKLPEQEPVAYDKTEMNCFIQDLYDKKMQEGKHGHYETMFHVVHQAIKRVSPKRTWVGLTNDEVNNFAAGCHLGNSVQGAIYKAEAKLRSKNNG